eukprot:CAMPEP_0172447942 /NCGR_PEP_ID=MMETSP1065-20121228/7078_1 /TAXON_ID=265537 /ORGANISM="Amphiprora paludosa, Strain CCMP125" /LENGTH=156 /DNA_ID=CAMNT_0013199315 /DNA_START=124 /DNA_END=594 /DNA_ORIENTATION=-
MMIMKTYTLLALALLAVCLSSTNAFGTQAPAFRSRMTLASSASATEERVGFRARVKKVVKGIFTRSPSNDISVPYDAAARLAYEESGKKMRFGAFKKQYLAEAVELVKSKQPIDVSIPYDAAAKLAFESSDKTMGYPEFKEKYEKEAVELVKSKQS